MAVHGKRSTFSMNKITCTIFPAGIVSHLNGLPVCLLTVLPVQVSNVRVWTTNRTETEVPGVASLFASSWIAS